MFQKCTLKKYLDRLPSDALHAAWEKYEAYFLDFEIQNNIYSLKEEQFQGEFLEKLFGEIFGFTLNPNPNFNLLRELKNETNAGAVDGAILKGQEVFAVIELKDTRTHDLTKVENQAFSYKHAHRGIRYVVISNFERLRFYIDNSLDYEEFNLFELTETDFARLYFCLSAATLLENEPLRALEESRVDEESITLKFYGDYSRFKRLLFANLCDLNADRGLDRLTCFRMAQKFIDRLIFVLFCEDCGLLPPNSVRRIIDSWHECCIWHPHPLYDHFRTFFGFVDSGQATLKIFAYDGGLFSPDELLDSLKIDDALLEEHSLRLCAYDYDSEVDVNILGHIFEHSLTEIEEIKGTSGTTLPASSEKSNDAGSIVPTTSKRKADGVFYTPAYVTRFMVKETLGVLCDQKKEELQISDEVYSGSETFTVAERKKREETLFVYRDWLLGLKICDPACGSGAFLVAVLDFLMEEHQRIDSWYAQIHYKKKSSRGQKPIILTDLDQSILERNLYGVDINEEAVEIARLSLWIHTCKRGRKLNDLTRNIKRGNSLLDSEFDWKMEFPFSGFDVVIGNPPYVQLQKMGAMNDVYAAAGYETYNKSANLYCLFTERGYSLLRPGGLQSFIMPNLWMITSYGKPLRQFLAKTGMQQLLNFGDVQFFDDSATICCIFVTSKAPPRETIQVLSVNQKNYTKFEDAVKTRYEYELARFNDESWQIVPQEDFQILQQMKAVGTPLKEFPITINYGIKTGFNAAFVVDSATKGRLFKEDPFCLELFRPLLRGRDIIPYGAEWGDLWLIAVHNGIKEKGIPPVQVDKYPSIKAHLDQFYPQLARRTDKGETPYNLRNCAYYDDFAKPKIIYPNMTLHSPFMFDPNGMLTNQKCFFMIANDDSVSLPFLTALFNSSFAKRWIWFNCPELIGGTREVSKVYFENFPVPPANAEQVASLAALAEARAVATTELQELRRRFVNIVKNNCLGVQLTAIMKEVEKLQYSTFIQELKRQKFNLSKREQEDWEDYFPSISQRSRAKASEISQIDSQIEREVKALYFGSQDAN